MKTIIDYENCEKLSSVTDNMAIDINKIYIYICLII